MKSDKPDIQKKQKKRNKTVDLRWILIIFFSTVLISAAMSLVSTELLHTAALAAAFLILLIIILIGILFDIIGVAVTAADIKPFHSMAAHRVPGAQEALAMIRQAEKVSSFCNDVIGDICGVISGTASASIAVSAFSGHGGAVDMGKIALAALVSGLTVGGKAVGKSLAMSFSTKIVHMAAMVVYYVKYMPRRISRALEKRKKQ